MQVSLSQDLLAVAGLLVAGSMAEVFLSLWQLSIKSVHLLLQDIREIHLCTSMHPARAAHRGGGGGGQLGHFAPGPSLKVPPEYLFKRSIYSNRAVRSKYSNRAVTVFFRGAV